MEVYLVGGAVRDQLLGRIPVERDWVVVGSTPEEMMAKGYRPVGKDFPVFIHPETGEEYALARIERKVGRGYHGFECFFAPNVTLEEDLSRRDLTINAMAQSQDGRVVDPFGGQKDLQEKKLRHVSAAFREDPLRLVRLARFQARFYSLGFSIAEETEELLLEMVRQGELADLTPGRVFKELDRALGEPRPDVFFEVLRKCGGLSILFPELDRLFGIPNPVQWHGEVDSGIHTLMALKRSAELTTDISVRFSVLCHDFGKANTEAKDWPSHPNHSQNSMALIKQFCKRYPVPNAYVEMALATAKVHGLFHRVNQLSAEQRLEVLEDIDAFRRPERLGQIGLACLADYQGRTGNESADYPQKNLWERCQAQSSQIDIQSLQKEGLKGAEFGARIRAERIKKIAELN